MGEVLRGEKFCISHRKLSLAEDINAGSISRRQAGLFYFTSMKDNITVQRSYATNTRILSCSMKMI